MSRASGDRPYQPGGRTPFISQHPDWRFYDDRLTEEDRENIARISGGDMNQEDALYNVLAGGSPYQAITWDEPMFFEPGDRPPLAYPGRATREERGGLADFYKDQAGMFFDPKSGPSKSERLGEAAGQSWPMPTFVEPRGADTKLPSSVDHSPADLTYSPTSSIYPIRPRTVAAGYDPERRVLTVMFRDGTLYNYYGVVFHEWGRFVANRSKGRFIKKFLDGKVHGYADNESIPLEHREALYRMARVQQVRQRGFTGKQRDFGRPTKSTTVKASTIYRARNDYKHRKKRSS